jgi:autotransporter-associated beta strand protein
MKPKNNRLFFTVDFRNATCLVVSAMALSSLVHAADITWADSAGNTTWTTSNVAGSAPLSASWVGGIAPLNAFTGTTDNAIFTSVSNAQPALTVQTRIDGVDFQMVAGGLAMTGGGGTGNLFQVGAGGIDSSLQTSGTNTITNARIVTSAASAWNLFSATDTASTSTFTFNSTVNLTSNLTVIGQRNSAAGNVGIINFERAITGTDATRSLTINSSNTNNTVNLNGINTYAGVTNVNGGIVNVSGDQTGATGGWNIQTPNTAGVLATVNFAAGSEIVVADTAKIQIGSTANSGSHPASTLNVEVAVDNQGTLQMERAGNLNLNNGAAWDQAGNLTLTARGGGSSTLTVNAGAEMAYTGSSTVKLTTGTSGSGLFNINGTGRFTTAAGFENTNAVSTGSGVSRITLAGGGTLRLSADVSNLTNQTLFTLGAGGGIIDNGGFNATLSGLVTAGSTTTATGITGAGGLTSSGVGTLTLTGINTYTGATNVNGGTLIVNGDISTSSLTTVASGATISGSGTVGALTVSTGGFINPGNSPGTLDVDGDYSQLGLYTAEINGLTAGTQHDQINVSGTVNITGGSLATMFTGTFSGLAQGATVTSYGGFDWQISYIADSTGNSFTGGNDIALMAIPEPSAALLGGLGIMLALLRRRRA